MLLLSLLIFLDSHFTNEFHNKFISLGIGNDAINFIHTCSFLEIRSDTGITLKKKHQYYAQVQLGMALLNLKWCDFIIYSSKSKTFLNIVVPFDEEFARDLIERTSEKYFKYMIHFICEKHNKHL